VQELSVINKIIIGMPRFLPVAMTALAVLASGTFGSGSIESRELAIAPSGFGQVGQTLKGVDIFNGTDGMEFGSNVALSDDGLRLAVSAFRNSPDNSTEDGAVFIYDYVGSEWVDKANFTALTDEEGFGRWPISMSPDGQTIAIRRGTTTRPAEVWGVDAAGVKTKLGGDVTCAETGSMVSLTKTSTGTLRLAAACEFDGSVNSGLVKVLDYNGTTNQWVEVGGSPLSVDPTGTTDGLFGFDMSWALQGTRLAISAPNYGNGTVNELGLVRVLDYDGDSTWTQLGSDIVGTQYNEKLGFTMGLSSNGETLVIGSPNKDVDVDDNYGAVQIYTLQSGTTWQFQQEIVGDASGDKLGRGISVMSDGTRFCASSYSHNSDRGQVQLFELSSGTWTSVAEWQGDEPGDLLGFNNMGVTMTPNGERLAMAGIHAQTYGTVQVFDDTFTPSPSLAPSLAPSASPAPTEEDIDVMVIDMTAFDWQLDYIGHAKLEFSQHSDTSEIKLHYNISIRDTKIQAYEYDCITPIPANVTTLTSETNITSTTNANFTVAIDIQQDTILSSPIWTDVGVGEGLISMCVRVDLVLNSDPDALSVNFHEQRLNVSVSLLQGFEISGIDLNRLNATEENGSADLDYNVIACQCDANRTCVDTVLTQGSDVYICVETTAPNVEIAEIRELTMSQNEFNTTPIVAGVEDPLTFVTIDGKEASIRYQIISAFFADPFPEGIVASGTVLLVFTDDGGRRLLRTSRVNIMQPERERELADGGEVQEGFSVVVGAQGTPSESSGAFARGAFGGLASLMVVVAMTVVGAVGGTAMVF